MATNKPYRDGRHYCSVHHPDRGSQRRPKRGSRGLVRLDERIELGPRELTRRCAATTLGAGRCRIIVIGGGAFCPDHAYLAPKGLVAPVEAKARAKAEEDTIGEYAAVRPNQAPLSAFNAIVAGYGRLVTRQQTRGRPTWKAVLKAGETARRDREVAEALARAKEAGECAADDGARPVTAAAIIAEVAQYYGLTEAEVRGKRRYPDLSLARRVAAWLIRMSCSGAGDNGMASMSEIGASLGRSDHTTILYALDRMGRELADPAGGPLRRDLALIRGALAESGYRVPAVTP